MTKFNEMQPFHTLHVRNLVPGVEYLFRVRCRTSVDWGQFIERSITTGPQINKEIQLESSSNSSRVIMTMISDLFRILPKL